MSVSFFRKNIKHYRLLAFFIPLALGLFAFILKGLRPFGNNTLMAIDAWGQYYPMLRDFLREPFADCSFSGGLMHDLAAQRAYYTGSPLWFLLFLFKNDPVSGVHLIVLLRLCLCSLFFSFSNERRDLWGLLMCGFYAFCGFCTAFLNQFMWLDAAMLLPLVMRGLEKLHRGERPYLYIGALAITIFSNFYVAWPVCIFCLLRAVCLEINDFKKPFLWRFPLFSIAAASLCAPRLLSVWRTVRSLKASSMGFTFPLRIYHGPFKLLARLLPGLSPSLEYGPPNIYFGLICALFALVYILSKNSRREKLTNLILGLFMLLSFDLNLLDWLWHGLHYPNQLPGRWSFIFAFWGLSAAAKGFDLAPARVKRLAAVLASVELLFSSLWGIHSAYGLNIEYLEPMAGEMTEFISRFGPEKGEFYRMETLPQRDNGGLLYGYNGISWYSSTMPGEQYDFFTRLGFDIYAQNVSFRYCRFPETDAIFGVKYLLSEGPAPGMIDVGSVGDKTVYLNPCAQNICFFAAPEAAREISGTGSAFRRSLFSALTEGRDISSGAEYLKSTPVSLSGVRPGYVEGALTATRDGVLVFSLPAAGARVTVDGEPVDTVRVGGYLLGVRLSPGKHAFSVVYRPSSLLR